MCFILLNEQLCHYRYSLPHLTQSPAGHVVSDGHLVSYLKSALDSAPHNVLLFLQDKVRTYILKALTIRLQCGAIRVLVQQLPLLCIFPLAAGFVSIV